MNWQAIRRVIPPRAQLDVPDRSGRCVHLVADWQDVDEVACALDRLETLAKAAEAVYADAAGEYEWGAGDQPTGALLELHRALHALATSR